MALTYFTLAELRAMPDIGDPPKYTDARLTAAGEWAEKRIEMGARTSFVPRSFTFTVSGGDQDDQGVLVLPKRFLTAVTAVKSNGVDFTAGQIAEVQVSGSRVFRRTVGTYTGHIPWDAGTRNIVITVHAGYVAEGEPPADIKDVGLQAARYRVLTTAQKAGLSDRATSLTNEFGNVQLSTASEDRPTGLPEVDAVIMGWRMKLAPRYGFA